MKILGEWYDEFFGLAEYDAYEPFEGEEDDPTQGDDIRTPWGGSVD